LVESIIVGRSSSHFTRVARIFALELGVACSLRVVFDLTSTDREEFGGNPALKIPILQAPSGTWFGALNICRQLSRQSTLRRRIVWPENLEQPLLANAQELVLQGMATEVNLLMAAVSRPEQDTPHQLKMKASLTNTLAWLEANESSVLKALPAERDLCFLEVTLFCWLTHLEFRKVASLEGYRALRGFSEQFSQRASARETAYRFDARD
jgi:glutathione S-transferase